MSRHAIKPTLWTLRKISTQISLSIPRRLTRVYTSHYLWIFWFRNHYFIPLSLWDGMCRSGLVCADYAGWSGPVHYAEVIMLVFSWNGSFVNVCMTNSLYPQITNIHGKYSSSVCRLIDRSGPNDLSGVNQCSQYNSLPHIDALTRAGSRRLF